MRMKAVFDYMDYMDLEYGYSCDPHELDEDLRGEFYRTRKWDVYRRSLSELCHAIGISSSHITMTLWDLNKYRLVEQLKDGLFKVYLQPRYHLVDQIVRGNSGTL